MDSYEPQSDPTRRESLPGEPAAGHADNVIVGWLEEPPRSTSDPNGPSNSDDPSNQDTLELSPQAEFSSDIPRRRRRMLPLVLFGFTCLSTFLAGLFLWNPFSAFIAALLGGQLD